MFRAEHGDKLDTHHQSHLGLSSPALSRAIITEDTGKSLPSMKTSAGSWIQSTNCDNYAGSQSIVSCRERVGRLTA